MTSRIACRLLAATAAMTIFASPAAAQNIDRIVAFGDSYADTGNFFKFAGINPIATQVYTTGRFSGGTNYIDTLSGLLHAPVDNFAIGGALTSQFNTNTGPSLGFPTEYLSFLSGGGGATPFPTVSGTFDEGDLLAISIGGNDARIYQTGSVALGVPVGTLAGAPAAGAASAAFATAGLDLLVAAGAPTISYLAGNTANIPEINYQADPAAAFAVRNAFFQSFDAEMRDTLAGYAADGVMVHYLDLNLVGDRVQANYAAFGLTGLACPAFPAPAGPGVPGDPTCALSPAAASQYLFYGDQLHLTSAGFAIVAHYIATQLAAPLTLGAPSTVGLDTARQFGRTLTTRMDTTAPRDGDMPEGMSAYLVGDTFSHRYDGNDSASEFKSTTSGLTAGVDYGFGSGMIGAALNVSRPKANFGTDSGDVHGKSVQLGGYAGAGIAGGFIQAYLGFGWDKHDISRRGVIDNLDADADGNHRLAGVKLGYLMPMGSVRVGPVVAFDHARAKVDGYTENGDEALSLHVDSVRAKSLRGSIGAELRGDFAGGGLQLRPFAAAVLEKEFNDGGRTIHFAQTSAPTIVNSWRFDDGSDGVYGRLTGGLSTGILSSVKLDATLSGTVGKDEGNETSGHLGVRMAF